VHHLLTCAVVATRSFNCTVLHKTAYVFTESDMQLHHLQCHGWVLFEMYCFGTTQSVQEPVSIHVHLRSPGLGLRMLPLFFVQVQCRFILKICPGFTSSPLKYNVSS
jgi:hypothetical protein